MKKAYFTLREVGNEECPNMGTIEANIKGAYIVNNLYVTALVGQVIGTHFDAEVIDCASVDLSQAYHAVPVEFTVTIDDTIEKKSMKIEVEHTFLYQ